MLTKREPTSEQAEVLRLISETDDNVLINSFAGTGKTTMLEMIEEVIEEPVLCLAFNKSTATTMQERFKSSTDVRTFNGLGHGIWGRANAANLKLDPKKTQLLFSEMTESMAKGHRQAASDVYFEVMEATNLARALGYVPDGAFKNVQGLCGWEEVAQRCDQTPSELVYRLTNSLLIQCIRSSYKGFIDFNDQIYMPALFGGAFPKYPFIMVDEKQDLNPCNHQMLQKLVRGRLASVGDPYQSIYQFRGAEMGGMAKAQTRFSMTETNLSYSFRCPQRIVENVRWRVPAFNWTKEGGHVHRLESISSEEIKEESAIICRNNAPLFKLAFHLLSHGRAVRVAGADIGPKLVHTMRRFGDQSISRSAVYGKIDAWLAQKLSKGSSTATDMAEAMRVFAERGSNLGQILAHIKLLFENKGTITLTTGHKAKGLEWNTVYHLDPHLIRIGDNGQEDNLRYVIDTRAKQALFYINSDDIQ
jgi:DNA helicase II / ATP-dependent DNA helicase PcrA